MARFLTILGAMVRLAERSPLLTTVAVDMRTTRSPICLITLRNRSLSPAARIFTETAFAVAKGMQL